MLRLSGLADGAATARRQSVAAGPGSVAVPAGAASHGQCHDAEARAGRQRPRPRRPGLESSHRLDMMMPVIGPGLDWPRNSDGYGGRSG